MIERPLEEVFSFVADLDNWARPASGERTYHTPVEVGDKFRQDLATQGQRLDLLGEVVGYEPNESLSFEYAWDGSSLELRFIFEPFGSGTKLTGKGEG